MGYNIQVVPAPLLFNKPFEVCLAITPPDVNAGDVYEIRELGGQPVVFDVGQVTVPAGAAGPVTLVFRSSAGFPAIAMAQIAVFNMAAPAVPVAQTSVNVLSAVVPQAVVPQAVVPQAVVPPKDVTQADTASADVEPPGWFGRGMAATAGWGTIIVTGLFFVAMIVGLVLLPFWAAGLIASHGTPAPAGSVAAPATPGASGMSTYTHTGSGNIIVNHHASPSTQPSKGKTAPKPKGSGSSGPP